MCRFLAYIGKKELVLDELITNPSNSLVKQSKHAKFGKTGINADGFGIGWYAKEVHSEPAVFRSIQPAWNDINLKSFSSKIKSKCFVGHVRASTVGSVNVDNCHPFTKEHYLFMHNGTIQDFDMMKRYVIELLDTDCLNHIQGNTDSEYFFALLMTILKRYKKKNVSSMCEALQETILIMHDLIRKYTLKKIMRLNTVFSDGNVLIATRFVSKIRRKPLSLYYAIGSQLAQESDKRMLLPASHDKTGAVIISSEPLNEYDIEWNIFPVNHMLVVSSKLNYEFIPINRM